MGKTAANAEKSLQIIQDHMEYKKDHRNEIRYGTNMATIAQGKTMKTRKEETDMKENNGWVKCPKCGKKKAYWLTDSYNLWCVACKAIVK